MGKNQKKVNKEDQLSEWAEKETFEVRELRKQLKRQHDLLRRAQSKGGIIIDAVKEVYEDLPLFEIPRKPRKQKKRKKEEEAWLHVSDTQIGKRTDTYSTEVASERLILLAEKVIEITETRRAGARIAKLNICLGGDMIEGENIFPGQSWEVDSDLFDQAIKNAPLMLTRMIMRLSEAFPEVSVVTVPGNHGRVGSKFAGFSKRTNFDNICYEVVKLMVFGPEGGSRSKELGKRIKFDISDTFYSVQDVAGWGVLCVHGDQIRGGFAGFPYYGTAKKAWGWIDSIPEEWKYLAFGHFHQFAMGTLNKRIFLANGTTECSNVYAQEQLAAAGDPCQRFAFFDKAHGLIADHQVFLNDSN